MNPQDDGAKETGAIPLTGDVAVIPLDNHPEHAAALGRLLGHWAYLELMLTEALAVLLRTQEPQARMIWQQFMSAKGKIDLIHRLNYACPLDQVTQATFIKYLNEAGKLNDMRNKYVHAIWAEGPGDLLTMVSNTAHQNVKKTSKPHVEVSAEQIQNDAKRIAELSRSLFFLLRHIHIRPKEQNE